MGMQVFCQGVKTTQLTAPSDGPQHIEAEGSSGLSGA